MNAERVKINSASNIITGKRNGSVCGARSGPVGKDEAARRRREEPNFEAVKKKKKSDVFNNRDKSLEFYRPITLSPPSLSSDRDKRF